jgi:hypothetical protein
MGPQSCIEENKENPRWEGQALYKKNDGLAPIIKKLIITVYFSQILQQYLREHLKRVRTREFFFRW